MGEKLEVSRMLLEVKDLSVYFPIKKGFFRRVKDHLVACEHISFALQEGKVLGIVGESGSGKTTLARAILRMIQPTSGEVLFRGKDVLDVSKREMRELRKKMQIVFQNPAESLNRRKTVFETIGEVLDVYELCGSEEKEDRIKGILEKVGLDATFFGRYPHELSIGQKQRISIARAISVEPELLVLDEPTSALDISVQAQVLNLLLHLLETTNMSYIFISHDLEVVYHLADVVLVMYEGKVVESGPAEDVLLRPQHPYTKRLVEAR